VSRRIAVWSPAGDGASTLLLNLAAAMVGRPVSFVAADLNLTTPSLALYADLLPHREPLAACLSRLLPQLEAGRLALADLLPHIRMAEGIPVLPGMLDPIGANRVQESHIHRLLATLADRFDLILIDTTPTLDSVAGFPLLEAADQILLVVGPGLASRFHARRYLLPLKGLGWERKTGLVANRATEAEARQVAADLGLPLLATIPEWGGMRGALEGGKIAYRSVNPLPSLARFKSAIAALAAKVAEGG
jgi:Mrp family chromosome partitioning ATPase